MAERQLPGLKNRLVTVTVGKNARISDTARFGRNVTIGDNVSIRPDCVIGNSCEIGDGVRLRMGVTLGMHVGLHGKTVLGKGCEIGDTSMLVNCSLAPYVTIGAKAVCYNTVMLRGTSIGKDCKTYGLMYEPTLIHAIIGRNVSISDMAIIGGKQPCHIGDDTQIFGNGDLNQRIGSSTRIGTRCHLLGSTIDDIVTIANNTKVWGSNIGTKAVVGSNVDITDATVGECCEIRDGVIVRRGTAIPADWLVPADYVVNPCGDGPPVALCMNTPPRT